LSWLMMSVACALLHASDRTSPANVIVDVRKFMKSLPE